MRILVVCGAGASSTFVAMRLRRAAQLGGIALSANAGTTSSLSVDLDTADILLVGPHLTEELPRIRAQAAPRGVRVVILAEDVFSDLDGSRTLSQLLPSLAGAGSAAPAFPAPISPTERPA